MKPVGPGAEVLVWDYPSRVCHWGFALSVATSLVIAFRFDPESTVFKYHMLLGIVAAWFLAVRIVLGFCGCPLSRWRAFVHPPKQTVGYFVDVIRWRSDGHEGLNPGTSLFAPALYLSLVALIVSGFTPDWVETWHGYFAWGAVGLIASHLAGLTLHAIRHRRMTPLAMVHGRRPAAAADAGTKSHFGWGFSLLALSIILVWWVGRFFDPNTSALPIPFLPEIEFPLIQKG